MRIEKDYEDLLRSLNENEVRYCIVGSFALAFHCKPRYTKDMDIFIEPSRSNARNLLRALDDFGVGSLGLSEEDFIQPGQIIQLGYEPVRVDLMTSIPGVDFSTVWKNRVMGKYGELEVPFISLLDLIASKKASGRAQDMADLEILQKLVSKK